MEMFVHCLVADLQFTSSKSWARQSQQAVDSGPSKLVLGLPPTDLIEVVEFNFLSVKAGVMSEQIYRIQPKVSKHWQCELLIPLSYHQFHLRPSFPHRRLQSAGSPGRFLLS